MLYEVKMKKSDLRQIIREEIRNIIFEANNEKTKITMMYITATGAEWLEVDMTITNSNYKKKIDSYVKKYQPQADGLVKKWRSNGENEILTLYIDGDNKSQVVRDASAYVESID